METYDFEVGDRVRLKSGTSYQRVVEIKRHQVVCQYISQPLLVREYAPDRLVLIDKHPKEDHMSKIYQTTDTPPRFGTFLAKNAEGKIVLEMKNPDGFEAFDPNQIEQVLPYTIQTCDRREFEVKPGQLEVGDAVLVDGNICRVARINTKSLTARAAGDFNLKKLLTADVL